MRLVLILTFTALTAYGLGAWLLIAANPEVAFWNEVVSRRDQALAETRARNPDQPVILFTGGSSCAFSIRPDVIEEICGRPAFNLGLPVACGRSYLLHQALLRAQPGDLLVVCLEPDMLAYPDQEWSPSKLGLALALHHETFVDAAGGDTFGYDVSVPQFLSLTRPGAGYLITLTGRQLTGRGYRYKLEDIRAGGYVVTPIREMSLKPVGEANSGSLDPVAREWLKTLAGAARERTVHLAYAMPWHLTRAEAVKHNRIKKHGILEEIQVFMPVIEDGFTGVVSDPALFSDSLFHLTEGAAIQRSQLVGRSLSRLIEANNL
jgi:hypothetical protein